MNRKDLIRTMARNAGISIAEANTVLDEILSSMARAVRAGDRVEVRGFGTFSARLRPARPMRHPRTGAAMISAQKRFAAFRASPGLLRLLNRDGETGNLGSNKENHDDVAQNPCRG